MDEKKKAHGKKLTSKGKRWGGGVRSERSSLTLFERCSLILLEPLDCDCLEAHPRRWILFQYVPHILLAEHEEIGVADRSDAGCSPVTCIDLAIYRLLKRCAKAARSS